LPLKEGTWLCVNEKILRSATTVCAGTLADPSYRATCETPCDALLDCNALCECYGSCGAGQICTCDACEALNTQPASLNAQFVDIQAVAVSVLGWWGFYCVC
jgi:hypothetical protein